uniref:Uncharacterized protein n=1 Tax=Pyramimonas orientalis virus TaxID=455367 RepID=A0A7L9AZ12_POV01|nr:hypothetical protein HWQ62_00409 [Pyramimonas orientalis virus]
MTNKSLNNIKINPNIFQMVHISNAFDILSSGETGFKQQLFVYLPQICIKRFDDMFKQFKKNNKQSYKTLLFDKRRKQIEIEAKSLKEADNVRRAFADILENVFYEYATKEYKIDGKWCDV